MATAQNGQKGYAVNPTSLKILRIEQVCEKTGQSKATVWYRINPKNRRYDASFPKPFRLSANGRAVGWLESEIDEWIKKRAESRL